MKPLYSNCKGCKVGEFQTRQRRLGRGFMPKWYRACATHAPATNAAHLTQPIAAIVLAVRCAACGFEGNPLGQATRTAGDIHPASTVCNSCAAPIAITAAALQDAQGDLLFALGEA